MPPKAAKGEYIETDTGNKVSRKSQIHGTQHVVLGGRTVIQAEVTIRADLCRPAPPPSSSTKGSTPVSISVTIGRYSFISTGTLLRPPAKLHRGVYAHVPLKIGDNVFIGAGCVVEAASIGNSVSIGKGSVIGKMAIIKDMVQVLEGTVVPAGMVIPVGSVVGGRPGRVIGDVGIAWEGPDGRELWRNTTNPIPPTS